MFASAYTYAAKGLVEHLLAASSRICVVDPLGVWWGLRAGADGVTPGFPVVVFGGRHADVALDEGMGAALGRLVGGRLLACVIDLSELGSAAARRRFMAAFAEALYETNREPLHLVLDEADLWSPQRPLPEANALLGRIEEIVRRGRVRGFIPWLITQRPAVVHKDVLSQADILIAMKLTSSQDRDAVGGWIEGQADRAEGRLLAALAQHAPARFTWGQAATLAGLKPSGGHYNAWRKQLRDMGLVNEAADVVTVSPAGMDLAGEVPPAPSSAQERLALWCSHLPSPAPEMLRTLAAQGERYVEPAELAVALGKKATGGHWNGGIALLRNNGLVELSGKRLLVSELFR